MTDREKMIEVINGWLDTDEQASYDLADRLIAAGFGTGEVKIIGVANMGKKPGSTEVQFNEQFTGYHGLIYGDKQ